MPNVFHLYKSINILIHKSSDTVFVKGCAFNAILDLIWFVKAVLTHFIGVPGAGLGGGVVPGRGGVFPGGTGQVVPGGGLGGKSLKVWGFLKELLLCRL